jgi:hypothetical protein
MGIPNLILLATALLVSEVRATDSRVCGECHSIIYKSYSATPMARTSGIVDDATAPLANRAEFGDTASAIRFQVTRKENQTFIHFAQGTAEGERRLDYFIGAGVVGRSYASSINGFMLQAPVSYYASTKDWDLSPGFEDSDRLTMTRPVEPACLNCHASDLRAIADTVNGYERPAFLQAGVSCERCHGPGETHVARMRSGNKRQGSGIVNPAKLSRAERDSVCAQCHLVGVIRVSKNLSSGRYGPGKRLFDSTSAFLWSRGAERFVANSHFEQLVRSACWNKSAGKMWCGTCHAAHVTIAPTDRVAFYRARCLACHTIQASGCSAPSDERTAAHDDCVACHMPSRPISTVAHAAQVDHTISRTPGKAAMPSGPDTINDALLVPFPGSAGDDRELGLAYATEAIPKNNRLWGERAFALLKKVASAHPGDAAVEVQLAQLYDRMGQEQIACNIFEQAVKDGASGTGALVNLGTCEAKRGDIGQAMKLWSEALQRNPAVEAARMNLAIAQGQSGDVRSGEANLKTALQYDPFSHPVRDLLRSMGTR